MLGLAVASLGLAFLSWKYVERPFRNRQFVGRGFVFTTGAAMSAVIVAIGLSGSVTNGYEQEFIRNNDGAMIARIKAMQDERQILIRAGECYFNTLGKHKDIASFLSNWDCAADPRFADAKPVPLIVVGDSHSADVVLALKLNGYAPLQMGGADCSLDPAFMTNDCREEFDYLLDRVVDDPATGTSCWSIASRAASSPNGRWREWSTTGEASTSG